MNDKDISEKHKSFIYLFKYRMLHPYWRIAQKEQLLKIWKLYGKYFLRYEILKMDNSAFLHISAR